MLFIIQMTLVKNVFTTHYLWVTNDPIDFNDNLQNL